MEKSFGVVINTGSGKDGIQNKLNLVKDAFKNHNLKADFYLLNQGTVMEDVVRRAQENGNNVLVAVGGDGTINGVASQLLGKDIALGVVPMGTLNHLAKDLNIPFDIDEAVEVLAKGSTEQIDVGMVNNSIFLNNSSIGLYSKLVHYREEHQKAGWSKRFAIVKGLVNVFKKYSFLDIEIEVGNEMKVVKSPLVFVGNNVYQIEGFDLGSRTSLQKGILSLYIVKHSTRMSFAKLCLRSLLGKLSGHEQFEEYTTKHATLNTKKPVLRVALDGEVVSLQTPLRFEIKEKALTVITPA